MATTKDTKEEKKPESTATTAAKEPHPDAARLKRRQQLAGKKLEKPVYLWHDGKFTSTIPARMGERIVIDPEAENFGGVEEYEIAAEQKVSGVHPKGTMYGSRPVREVVMITDELEAADLQEKGFKHASAAQVKEFEKSDRSAVTDNIAARDRKVAAEKLRRMERPGMRGQASRTEIDFEQDEE